jgi:undecaprenyl phosphate-alpha-L-ara4FN deformylase
MGIIKRPGGASPHDPTRKNPLSPPPEAVIKHVVEEDPGSPDPGRAAFFPGSEGLPHLDPHQKILGLRVDVASAWALRKNLPNLEDLLKKREVHATFFFTMGPERTGKLLLGPLPAWSMLPRSYRLARLAGYPLGSLATGILPTSKPLGTEFRETLDRLQSQGHETGCLGWDYWGWRSKVPGSSFADSMAIADQEKALDAYRAIMGVGPIATASPGCVCTEDSLRLKEDHGIAYASDSWGTDPFLPVLGGRVWKPAQVPVTLPTIAELFLSKYDSINDCYTEISNLKDDQKWPVLQVSAEWEGGALLGHLDDFLRSLQNTSWMVVPLGVLLAHRISSGVPLPRCTLSYGSLEGRTGAVTLQMLEV